MRRASSFCAALLTALLITLPLCAAGLSPETGSYIFQHYTPDQYNASPQNWDIVQDSRGVMYFGNTDGALEFDGISWRLVRVDNGSFARALAIDSTGTLYIGGVKTFGALRPDNTGTLHFVSLLDKVPNADRQFSDLWRILPTRDGVYFSAYERLFRLNKDGSVRVWRPVSNFGRAFTMQGDLFVKTREKGLMKMQNDTLVPVPGGDVFEKIGITAGATLPNGDGLIATPAGFFLFRNGAVVPFPTAADSFVKENQLYTIHVFPDGEIAAGTVKAGVALLSPDGRVDRILTKANGLTDDYISSIYEDRQGGVWLAGNIGITRLNPGLSHFDASFGLEGDVQSIARAGGILYAGTTTGLFRLHSVAGGAPRFDRVPEIQTSVLTLVPRGADILAATEHGLFLVSQNNVGEISGAASRRPIYDVGSSQRDPSIVYYAGSAGVFALRRDGNTWKTVSEFAPPGQEFRSLAEDPDGRVWATTKDAIWRIDFRPDPPKMERFADAQGAPTGWKNAKRFHGHVVFSTTAGQLRFSESAHRFEPDQEFTPQFSDGKTDVFNFFEEPSGSIWLTGEKYHGLLTKLSTGYRWARAPLLSSGIQEIYWMSIDPDGVVWATGAKGILYRWERGRFGNPDLGFSVLTRRVATVDNRNVIYGGAGSFPSVSLPWRQNGLRFEFAAPFSEDPVAVDYQVMLEGSDSSWSDWSHETRRDYTHLPEGSYRFHVRARSPHLAMSEDAAVALGILPPWYRTNEAYAFYAALLALGVWGLIRWRTAQLVEKTRQLEKIVEERTVEIREQRDEIQRQERQGHALLLNILPESVAEELKTTGSVKPVGFDEVTVCFTDFVGFTLSSEKMAPAGLVDALHEYFSAFDLITTRYGLEKLKTIGDAYMFASGLPTRRASHAVDAAMAALEMVAVVKELAPRTGWNIRVGLHSGPVVAGVVGTRKFAFDIWGSTVNLASRMESSGVPGRVNISERTFQLTRGLIACEARGHIQTKDKRELPMFIADGIRADFLAHYEKEFGVKPDAWPAAEVTTLAAPA